ncbi:hypothetical protein [Parabacteroides goldsteinii]|uniref:hypothetical protein n=1 Tax=Parabacteroides goldsteinii TaxID=328812 RepID=UPI00101B7475|nr:hypothetical protein [Parabacteroides goldsteinii]
MKRIYLYIAILISLVANIFFYSIMKKNDNKVVPQNTVASDEYLNEELGKAYSYLKLNGKKFENIKGTLGYQDKTIGRTELETLIRGDNVVFYFSDLSCSSCIMEHLNSLEKLKKVIEGRMLIVSHLPRKDVQNELVRLKSEIPVFYMDEEYVSVLEELSGNHPTATTLMIMDDLFVVSSCVTDSQTKHFNPEFYDAIVRFFKYKVIY